MTRKTYKRGGAENWIGYIYTKDEARRTWIDVIAPLSSSIVSVLPKIDWSAFKYEGPIEIELEVPDDTAKESFSTGTHTITLHSQCISNNKMTQYQVFGGGACELWGKAFPQVPIRKYVDYTGDIDIRVALPSLTITDVATLNFFEEGDFEFDIRMMQPVLVNDKGYTPYGEAFTHWLYDEIVSKITTIAPYFNKKEIVLPDFNEDDETAVSDIRTELGNLLVTRAIVQEGEVIKIQIATKTVLGDISIMNHLMEFILPTKGTFTLSKVFTVDNIPVEDPMTLLFGQLKGLTDRGTGIKNALITRPNIAKIENYPSFYKFDNHCARLLYLAHLQKFVEGKKYPGSKYTFSYLTEAQVINILASMYKRGISTMCYTHFGDNYMDRLITVFESMKYINEGRLTTKIANANKAILNRAKSEAGGSRRKRRTIRRKTQIILRQNPPV